MPEYFPKLLLTPKQTHEYSNFTTVRVSSYTLCWNRFLEAGLAVGALTERVEESWACQLLRDCGGSCVVVTENMWIYVNMCVCWQCVMRLWMEMSTASENPRVEYAYSYQNTPTGVESEGLVIKLKCPGVLSFKWCLKLYSLVLGGLGLLLSFIKYPPRYQEGEGWTEI